MKKILTAILLATAFLIPGKAHALIGPFVQITTGTLQPGTTNGFYVSSGTAVNLNSTNFKVTVATITNASITNSTITALTGTLGNSLNANNQKITNVSTGTAAGDGVRFAQIKLVQTPQCFTVATSSSIADTTFRDTNLSGSITPSSTSNKVLVMASGLITNTSGVNNTNATLARASSNLLASAGQCIGGTNQTGLTRFPCMMIYLDSPASTSSLSYSVQLKVSGGTGTFGDTNTTQTLCLFEIAP